MTPNQRWEIIHGDCLEVMKTIAMPIDHIITDPPYGLSFRGAAWDESIPHWFQLAQQLTSSIIFTTAPTTLWDYPRPDWVLNWIRLGAVSRTAQGGFNHWSPIPVYGHHKFPTDCIRLDAVVSAAHVDPANDHECPKPEALLMWLIEHSTQPGDLILDPFAGSGTTGAIALRLGRRFLGIEIREQWVERASERLRAEETNSTLSARRHGQEALFR